MEIDTMTLADIAEIIKDIGVTGVLIVGIVAFVKGLILPRGYVDEMKEHAETQTTLLAEKMGDTILKGTSIAVEAGVTAAAKHMNSNPGLKKADIKEALAEVMEDRINDK